MAGRVKRPSFHEEVSVEELRQYIDPGVFDEITRGVSLFQWQIETCRRILREPKTDFIVEAPTGGGKTKVGEILVADNRISDRDKLVMVPLNSIAEEQARRQKRIWQGRGHVELLAGTKGKLPGPDKNKITYVATYEKAHNLIDKLIENGKCETLGLVIVDEIHVIGDERRGYYVETCILKLKNFFPNARIVGLSATIGADKGRFLSMLGENTHLCIGQNRPIVLQNHAVVPKNGYEIYLKKDDSLQLKESIPSAASETTVVKRLAKKEGSTLVFVRSKSDAVTMAVELSERRTVEGELADKQRELLARLRLAGCYKSEDEMQMILSGVAYHSAWLTQEQRGLIEDAMRGGIIKTIACTTTLAMGINLPARRVVICSELASVLNGNTYQQICGRAGRIGLESTGETYLFTHNKEAAKRLMTMKPQEIKSRLSGEKLQRAILELIGLQGDFVIQGDELECCFKHTLLATEDAHIKEKLREAREMLVTCGYLAYCRETSIYRTTLRGRALQVSGMDPADFERTTEEMNELIFDGTRLSTPHSLLRLICGNKVAEENMPRHIANKRETAVQILSVLLESGGTLQRAAARFLIRQGTVQSLVSGAVTNGSRILSIAQESSGMWMLACLLEGLLMRLTCTIPADLELLLSIRGIKRTKLRQLIKANFDTLAKLAGATAESLMEVVPGLNKISASGLIMTSQRILLQEADS